MVSTHKTLVVSNEGRVSTYKTSIVPHDATVSTCKTPAVLNDVMVSIHKSPIMPNEGMALCLLVFGERLFISEKNISRIKWRPFISKEVLVRINRPLFYFR